MVGEIPEAGQLVQVRRREFVVTEVVRSSLQTEVLDGIADRAQHVVRLASVEDDGLGDELEVIWELEPNAIVRERALLPSPRELDDPRYMESFLNAVRWGAVQSADRRALQSPFRAGIVIEDYQLDPVVRALEMPRVNLLIADDVGLGKTIEAGLVAQELILRNRARRILVVVPASLQIKWRDEMQDRFGLEFRIVDTELMRDLRRRRGIHVNPWTHHPRLITSIDFLKRERPLRQFRECLPGPGEPTYPRRFDLMIVDEAHNVAPSGTGRYATDSQRTQAIRSLVPHFEHKLFLTATPHNGYKESFSALLELLDDQRFAREVVPDRQQLEAVMVRRLKTEITDRDGRRRFHDRKIVPIEVEYTEAERTAHGELTRYAALHRERTGEGSQRMAAEFVLKLLKKRLFSSPAAFAATLDQHEQTLRGLKRKVERVPPPRVLRRELERGEEEAETDDEYEEAGQEALATATSLLEAVGEEQAELVKKLGAWAETHAGRADSKAEALMEWLDRHLRPNGRWNDERVIIFTEYRATQNWLLQLLAARGLAGEGRVERLFGGMDTDERERIKAAFQAHPSKGPVRILLATDTASEGIDLQKHCHRLIHYEIPWNPNRLEQRNGRIDRHGQSKQPLVYHFVGSGWSEAAGADRPGDLEGDLEFLMRAAIKVESIRDDLRKVGPVIAGQVEDAMLGRRRQLDTTQAERDAEPVRRMLRFERDLRERIGQLHDRLLESRQALHIDADTVKDVVEVALSLAGQPPLAPSRRGEPEFEMPRLQREWARCAERLEDPHTGERRAITFDDAHAAEHDDVVLIHLSHPLVQMSQRLLRAQVWATDRSRLLNRMTARSVPDDTLDAPAVVSHARLLVTGGTQRRLHEQIIAAGGLIGARGLDRFSVTRAEEVLARAGVDVVPEVLQEEALREWDRLEEPVMRAISARTQELRSGILRRLEERAGKEARDVEALLDELARSIQAELEAEPPPQLDLFGEDERWQFEANRKALERRLAEIPPERDREMAEVAKRYADPELRMFPICVTFLYPESYVRRQGR